MPRRHEDTKKIFEPLWLFSEQYMSIGYHHFFVFKMHESNHIERKQDYFIGGLVGDTHNDEHFKNKIEMLCEKLQNKYGLTNYIYCWSPLHTEPKQQTHEQRFHTAVKKSENKTKKKIAAIKKENFLFGETYIEEEMERLDKRKEVLKKRYLQ
jgi:hypothetical protein